MRPVLRTTGFVLTILATASWNWAHPRLDYSVRADAPSEAEMNQQVENDIEQQRVTEDARAAERIIDSPARGCGQRGGRTLALSIARSARANHVSVTLVAATVVTESSCQQTVVSRAGAVGLMQIDRHTWRQYSRQELLNPDRNIEVGTKILAGYVRQTGNTRDGLRHYFGVTEGSTAADDYADRVLAKEGKSK